DPPEHGLLLAPWRRWREVSHQQQGGDRGQVAHRVEQEADRHANDGDEHARNGWSDDCRSVEDRRVERDRVQEVVLADHVDLERLPQRNEHPARRRLATLIAISAVWASCMWSSTSTRRWNACGRWSRRT